MNKTYKYTLTAHEKKEISFETGVARLAIANGDGVDGSTTVIMSEITKQHSGDLVSFIDGADAPFADFIVNIEAVQSGSGDPSPTNVRPISGWTGANIYTRGLNIWDEEWELGVYDLSTGQKVDNSTNIRCKNLIPVNPSNQLCWYNATSNVIRFVYYDKDRQRISTNATTQNSPYVFTIPNNARYMSFYYGATTYSGGICISYYPPTNNEYVAHDTDNETINIDWQSIAGTVYGGYINLLTGVLTVTYANIASYDGETINEPWISSMDKYVAGASPTTGAQVVYPLTTPVTYQLTPVEVRSILGLNNVWADCGPVDIRYFVQSTQPMIDYIDEKTIVYFDAQENFSTYGISLVGATSTDVKNCLKTNKNANIVIRVKHYSTVELFYLHEYSPNYFADFASHAVIFDAEGTKSMRINYMRLDLTQETTDFTNDHIILPAT